MARQTQTGGRLGEPSGKLRRRMVSRTVQNGPKRGDGRQRNRCRGKEDQGQAHGRRGNIGGLPGRDLGAARLPLQHRGGPLTGAELALREPLGGSVAGDGLHARSVRYSSAGGRIFPRSSLCCQIGRARRRASWVRSGRKLTIKPARPVIALRLHSASTRYSNS